MDLDYENFPEVCSHCKKIGHYVAICKSLNKNEDQEGMARNNKQAKEQKMQFIQTKDGRKEQGKNLQNPIIVEETRFNGKDKGKAQLDQQTSSSGAKLQENIAHTNRFMVLQEKEADSQQEIIDSMRKKDRQLEVELEQLQQKDVLNEKETHNEDSSSQGSFVDATQVQNKEFMNDDDDDDDAVTSKQQPIVVHIDQGAEIRNSRLELDKQNT